MDCSSEEVSTAAGVAKADGVVKAEEVSKVEGVVVVTAEIAEEHSGDEITEVVGRRVVAADGRKAPRDLPLDEDDLPLDADPLPLDMEFREAEVPNVPLRLILVRRCIDAGERRC